MISRWCLLIRWHQTDSLLQISFLIKSCGLWTLSCLVTLPLTIKETSRGLSRQGRNQWFILVVTLNQWFILAVTLTVWYSSLSPPPTPPPKKKKLLGSHSMPAPLQRQLALNKSNECWKVHTLHFPKSADHSAPPEGCWGLPGQHSAWLSSCWILSNTTQITSQTSQGKEGCCI